jgi:hypothetical protein
MKEYGVCPAFGYQCEYVAMVESQAEEIQKLKAALERTAVRADPESSRRIRAALAGENEMLYQGRVVQDGLVVAQCSSKNEERMLGELMHFTMVYGQDGPVRADVRHGKGRWRNIGETVK